MTSTLVFAIIVLIVGLMLLLAELFIPSGGILGILAAVALIGSIVLAFTADATAGVIFLFVIGVALPVVVVGGMELWPKSPIGRRMLLSRPTEDEVDPHIDHDRDLLALVGQVGRTITPLRPAGMTDFNGRRVDTVAEGMIIEPGSLVRVMEVRGRRVLVRKVEDDLPTA